MMKYKGGNSPQNFMQKNSDQALKQSQYTQRVKSLPYLLGMFQVMSDQESEEISASQLQFSVIFPQLHKQCTTCGGQGHSAENPGLLKSENFQSCCSTRTNIKDQMLNDMPIKVEQRTRQYINTLFACYEKTIEKTVPHLLIRKDEHHFNKHFKVYESLVNCQMLLILAYQTFCTQNELQPDLKTKFDGIQDISEMLNSVQLQDTQDFQISSLNKIFQKICLALDGKLCNICLGRGHDFKQCHTFQYMVEILTDSKQKLALDFIVDFAKVTNFEKERKLQVRSKILKCNDNPLGEKQRHMEILQHGRLIFETAIRLYRSQNQKVGQHKQLAIEYQKQQSSQYQQKMLAIERDFSDDDSDGPNLGQKKLGQKKSQFGQSKQYNQGQFQSFGGFQTRSGAGYQHENFASEKHLGQDQFKNHQFVAMNRSPSPIIREEIYIQEFKSPNADKVFINKNDIGDDDFILSNQKLNSMRNSKRNPDFLQIIDQKNLQKSKQFVQDSKNSLEQAERLNKLQRDYEILEKRYLNAEIFGNEMKQQLESRDQDVELLQAERQKLEREIRIQQKESQMNQIRDIDAIQKENTQKQQESLSQIKVLELKLNKLQIQKNQDQQLAEKNNELEKIQWRIHFEKKENERQKQKFDPIVEGYEKEIQNLMLEVSELKVKNSEYQKKSFSVDAKSQEQINRYQQSIKQKDDEISKLKSLNNEKNQELFHLQGDIQQLQLNLENLSEGKRNNIQQLDERIQRERDLNNQNQQDMRNLRKDFQEVQDSLQASQTNYSVLEREHHILSALYQELKQKESKSSIEYSQLYSDAQRHLIEKSSLNQQILTLNQQYEALKNEKDLLHFQYLDGQKSASNQIMAIEKEKIQAELETKAKQDQVIQLNLQLGSMTHAANTLYTNVQDLQNRPSYVINQQQNVLNQVENTQNYVQNVQSNLYQNKLQILNLDSDMVPLDQPQANQRRLQNFQGQIQYPSYLQLDHSQNSQNNSQDGFLEENKEILSRNQRNQYEGGEDQAKILVQNDLIQDDFLKSFQGMKAPLSPQLKRRNMYKFQDNFGQKKLKSQETQSQKNSGSSKNNRSSGNNKILKKRSQKSQETEEIKLRQNHENATKPEKKSFYQAKRTINYSGSKKSNLFVAANKDSQESFLNKFKGLNFNQVQQCISNIDTYQHDKDSLKLIKDAQKIDEIEKVEKVE